MLNRVRDLEAEVAELKAWNAEKEKYQLTKINPLTDVFAYTSKNESGNAEASHSLCPQCYQENIKSILQKETRAPFADVLVCNRCGSELYVMGRRYPEHTTTKKSPWRSHQTN